MSRGGQFVIIFLHSRLVEGENTGSGLRWRKGIGDSVAYRFQHDLAAVLILSVPGVQAAFSAVVDGVLDLGQGDAGHSVVDEGVSGRENEGFDDGGAEVVVGCGERALVLAPFEEKDVGVEGGGAGCAGAGEGGRHCALLLGVYVSMYQLKFLWIDV